MKDLTSQLNLSCSSSLATVSQRDPGYGTTFLKAPGVFTRGGSGRSPDSGWLQNLKTNFRLPLL